MTDEMSRGLQRAEKEAVDAQFELISPHSLNVLTEIVTTSKYPLSAAKFENRGFPV